MTKHAVLIAGGDPRGLVLAAELALARADGRYRRAPGESGARGHVVWIGSGSEEGLREALGKWFGG